MNEDSELESFADLPNTDLSLTDSVYPPPDSPLSAVTADDVMRTQATLIRDLMTAVSMVNEDKNRFLLPVIKNLAAFVHLLPASQSHHHNGRGGLFRHSLETALFAVNIAKNRILDVNANPSDSYHNKSRWYLAIAIAGLLHDAGKCLTDMTVTAQGGSLTWMPTTENLADWLKRHQIQDFFCTWNLNRVSHQHECAGSILYSLLVPKETRRYLEESHSTKLKNELYESLAGIKREGAEIAATVVKADSASTKKDLSRQLRQGFHPGVNSPIVVLIEKIMQELVEKNTWKVNEEGSPLWVTDRGVFLIWYRAVKDIERVVVTGDYPSLPRDSGVWLDKLTESSLVENRFLQEDDLSLRRVNWSILPLPELESQNDSNTLNFLTAIKLADNTLLFANGGKPTPVMVFVEGETLSAKEEAVWLKTTNLPMTAFVSQSIPAHVQAPPLDDREALEAMIACDYQELVDQKTGEVVLKETEERIATLHYDENEGSFGFYHDSFPYPDVEINHILEEMSEELPHSPAPLKKKKSVIEEVLVPKLSMEDLLSPSQLAARKQKAEAKNPVHAQELQTHTPAPTHADTHTHEYKKPKVQRNKDKQASVVAKRRVVDALIVQVKEELLAGQQVLLEDLSYRDDCVFASTAPIEAVLKKEGIELDAFVDRVMAFQTPPVLRIDDKRDYVYIERNS